MERSNFFNDQDVLCDDLNNIESTKVDSIEKHTLALVASGSVIGQPGSTALFCQYGSATSFLIYAGTALDSNGEIITIPTDLSILKTGGFVTNLTWASGPAGPFYIKLQYYASSGSFKANDAGVSYPTRYTDSYWVTINSVAPLVTDVCIGSFTADAGGAIASAITDTRIFVRTKAFDDRTYLSASPIGGHTVVKDHILAKGSGTQTTTNPHGITLSDLGYSDSSNATHWQDAHTNGIMLLARDAGTLQSWSGSIINTTIDYLTFTPPTQYAVMNISGGLFSGSIAPLLATSAPSDGVFWVVTAGSNTAQFLPTGSYSPDSLNPHKYPAYLNLGLATVSNSRADINSYVNTRDMFVMSPADVRADILEASSTAALTEASTIIDNMNRIRAKIGGNFKSLSVDLSGTKLLDTEYQNTTSSAMFLTITASSTDLAPWDLHLLLKSSSGCSYPTDEVSVLQGPGTTLLKEVLYGMIPSGFFYKIYKVATAISYTWREQTNL